VDDGRHDDGALSERAHLDLGAALDGGGHIGIAEIHSEAVAHRQLISQSPSHTANIKDG
jgi:hypothetical protein